MIFAKQSNVFNLFSGLALFNLIKHCNFSSNIFFLFGLYLVFGYNLIREKQHRLGYISKRHSEQNNY